MMQRLRALKSGQDFCPSWIGVLVNPFYIARAGLCAAMQEFGPELSGRLLDVGCGTKPYQTLFDVDTYVGLEIDSAQSADAGEADRYYDGVLFPFTDASFDSILCNQVLEHVFTPDTFISEIARVLTSEGKLLLTVPFAWDEHEQPQDYARYSSFGLRSLLERHGFEVVRQRKMADDASVLFQLGNAYLFKITERWSLPLRLLVAMPVSAMVNVAGLLARFLLPTNPDLYLDQVVLAQLSGTPEETVSAPDGGS